MKFEGEDIDTFSLTIRQAKLPYSQPLSRGEIAKLVIEVEVFEVAVRENLRTGEISRVHTVKVKDVQPYKE